MMNEDKNFTFVLGGARSGKSAFALSLASDSPAPRVYIATARALDAEMRERINKHQKERGEDWETVEEPEAVASRLKRADAGVVLVDCITLWLSNRIEAGLDDRAIMAEVEELGDALAGAAFPVVVVSNETGLGIVPENALARRFRDLAGAANRTLAGVASDVYFIAAGIPIKLK